MPEGLVLPTATLVIAVAPYVARIMRASMVEVLESDYVEMARLKGLPERTVLIRHALPNAIGPVFQVIAINLAYLAGGVVVVEYVFNYPGIGSALQDAVVNHDLPVVQALAMLIAGVYVVLEPARRRRDDPRHATSEDTTREPAPQRAPALAEGVQTPTPPVRSSTLVTRAMRLWRTRIGALFVLVARGHRRSSGRYVAPHTASEFVAIPNSSPGGEAGFLGTDYLGQDVLSRFLYGGSEHPRHGRRLHRDRPRPRRRDRPRRRRTPATRSTTC
ncbi:MAG: ABC transporter permease subunit [Nocardioidaceae bacterium]